MAKNFMTVCVFCLLCATHTPCSAHVEYSQNEKQLEINQELDLRQVKPLATDPLQPDDASKIVNYSVDISHDEVRRKNKRDTHGKTKLDESYYIEKIFTLFGNGESMNYKEFENFIKVLNLDRMLLSKFNSTVQKNSTSNSNIVPNRLKSDNVTCINGKELLKSVTHDKHDSHSKNSTETNFTVDSSTLRKLCPLLLYQMAAPTSLERQGCIINLNNDSKDKEMFTSATNAHMVHSIGSVWLYSTISIIIISTCGLLGVLVIPIMQQHFYQHLIQFLVALAVGTLSGDALLHLLPHAMMSHDHAHGPATEHSHEDSEDPHIRNMWRGFVAMVGLIFFFFMEKCLTLGAEWRKQRQLRKNKVPTRVRIMREPETATTNAVGEKLCKHKYSSYPYCYDVIATETQEDLNNKHMNNITNANTELHNNTTLTKDIDSDSEFITRYIPKSETNQNLSKCTNASKTMKCSESNKMLAENVDSQLNEDFSALQNESYTVILREHENTHHGHSHTHGHVHSAPKNLSSVAWMVVMGDGLHNFTDGMAIGAAFAGSLAGGFSTAVAVFCHELPHEIGDFAVLLKAGMTAKQAVFYNMLSSVLCIFGMVLGVSLGNSESASGWIFACAAGMFLYIALVDMIPELTTSHSKEGGSFLQCGLQFMGLLSGLGIMLLIAMYEENLKTLFDD